MRNIYNWRLPKINSHGNTRLKNSNWRMNLYLEISSLSQFHLLHCMYELAKNNLRRCCRVKIEGWCLQLIQNCTVTQHYQYCSVIYLYIAEFGGKFWIFHKVWQTSSWIPPAWLVTTKSKTLSLFNVHLGHSSPFALWAKLFCK